MDPIHQAIAWLTLAQQIEFAGDPLWHDVKAVFAKYEVDIDIETLDLCVACAAWRRTLAGNDTGEER